MKIGFNFIGLNEIRYEPITEFDYIFLNTNNIKDQEPNYHNFNFIYERVNSDEIFLRLVIIK